MATENRKLIEKADLGLQDLVDGGGALNAANAKKFMEVAIAEANFLPRCTVVPMEAQEQRISLIGLADRILRAGTPNTALDLAERAKPNLSNVTLSAKLYKAEIDIPDEVVEDAIGQQRFDQLVLSMIPKAVGRDLDEAALQGDTDSADSFLAVQDGVIKLATSNLVDFNNSRVTFDLLGSMLRAVPKHYKRLRDKMEILTSYNAEDDYRKLLDQRETQAGDESIRGSAPVRFRGVPIVPIGMMPDDIGGVDQTVALLCHPKTFVVGWWRHVRVEIDRDKRAGNIGFIVTTRVAFQIAEKDSVVKGTEILNS